MNKINKAIREIYELDEIAEGDTKIHLLHPLVKLILTVLYITGVVSYDKYDLIGLLPMLLYPVMSFSLADIPIRSCFRKFRIVLPMIFFVGIFNPFFDTIPLYKIGDIHVTGGMISMMTLIIKGIYTLMASYILIASTGMERICYALRMIHVPSLIVTQILLAYRYIILLMSEANAVTEAYSLRAPKEKGVKYKVWGSLLGQLLYRSLDRAGSIYDSMLLRGFNGEFDQTESKTITGIDVIYLIIWTVIILTIRLIPIIGIIH